VRLARFALAVVPCVAAACAVQPPTDLDTLVQRDSTYLAPETLEPFSGRVVRRFANAADRIQIEGTLQDGIWEGELTVYHESGRIRYQGDMHAGAQCGAWVENREDEEAGSAFSTLMRDVESLSLYPECPKG